VALIYPDAERMQSNNISRESLVEILEQYRREVNAGLPKYMNVTRFEIHSEEFVKTPKRSIKRYLYD
jgi:long-chain acyl-CoA synthetase